MVSLDLVCYAWLELRFLNVETIPGPRHPVPGACRILCSNVGVFPRTWAMWQWLRPSMICCCALRPWSLTGIIYQSCWFLDSVVLSYCARLKCRGPVGWLHMCEMDMGHFDNPNLSVAVVRCWYSGCAVLGKTSACSVCIATLTLMIGYMIVY